MTTVLAASAIADKIKNGLPQSSIEPQGKFLLVTPAALPDVLACLKTAPGLEFDYLSVITATDYWDYFELVYQLVSLSLNHTVAVKTRVSGRQNLSLPSVVSIYQTADYQEREIFELLGISFNGHPDLRPLFLWEGFRGYPLRKDYL